MAFDQDLISKELRPLNVARTVTEEPRITPRAATTETPTGRYIIDGNFPNMPQNVGNPRPIPVYYSTAVPNAAGFVGYGYVNPELAQPQVPVVSGWTSPVSLGVGQPVEAVHVPLAAVQMVGTEAVRVPYAVGQSMEAKTEAEQVVDVNPNLGFGGNGNLCSKVSSSSEVTDQSSNGSTSGIHVKLLCSFGGKILPRPSDGMLRYVGGQTRIVSVRRDVSFNELVQKMVSIYGQPLVIKYQLPGEDLDALVSISCSEDLENMIDEYSRLTERSSDGSQKLRVFLFLIGELDLASKAQFFDLNDSVQRYVDAVNGYVDEVFSGGIVRKESIESAASNHNSDNLPLHGQGDVNEVPVTKIVSPRENVVNSQNNTPRLAHVEANAAAAPLDIPAANPVVNQSLSSQTLDMERSGPFILQQQTQLGLDLQQVGVEMASYLPNFQTYVSPHQNLPTHTQVPVQLGLQHTQILGTPGSLGTFHQFNPAVHMTMNPSSHMTLRPNMFLSSMQPQPQQSRLTPYPDGNTSFRTAETPIDQNYNLYQVPLQPTVVGGVGGGGIGWRPAPVPEHNVFTDVVPPRSHEIFPEKFSRLDDCHMCQKALPHAHSDSLVQEQKESVASPDSNSVYHSLQLNDNMKLWPANRVGVTGTLVEGMVDRVGVNSQPMIPSHMDHQAAIPQSKPVRGTENLELHHGTEQVATQKTEDADQNKITDPQSVAGFVQYPYGVILGQEHAQHKHLVSTQYQIKPDPFMNRLVYTNISPIIGGPVPSTEHVVHAYPEHYPTNLRPLHNARQICPSDVFVSNELNNLPIVRPINKDILHQKHKQINQGPYASHAETRISHMASNEVSCSDLTFDKMQPVTEWKDYTVRFQSKLDYNDVGPAPLNCNIPSSLSPPNMIGIQEPNSLFSNQDPYMRHDAHLPPPKPNNNPTKKEASQIHNCFGNSKVTQVHLENDIHLASWDKNKGSAEEHIKQELQAVAEGVAASVLQSASNSNAESVSLHERNESAFEANQGKETQTSTVETQHQAKIENIKPKQPEETNLGFPASDGIGRLQIILNSDLEELQELGSGTFGTVYHGKWKGTDVAIKRINERCFAGKPSEQEHMRDDFWNEAINLADLHHPNVVAFYGVVLDGPGGSVATVTEFMVNGSLRRALQKSERNIDMRKRLLIAMDVAFGMEYLHGKNVVHFDLKSDNLLVNLRDPHRPICKVGDLGLSKVKRQTLISGGVRGTLPWMAPELLNGSNSLVSEKVDVFSFGIVMWELITGEEPYADLHYGAIIGGIVSNTLRPPVPEGCDPEWRSLMEKCWSAEPQERPSFTEVADHLRAMSAKIPTKAQSNTQPQIQKS